MDVGGTATDTGAIIIEFDPIGVPDGIMAVYDGVVYNTVSSPQFGLLESTVPGVPTYIGSTGSDCGTAGGGTYPNLPVFQYIGNQFVNTNQPTTIQIQSGQSQLTSGAPGDCVMVIPKPNASPAIVNFTFIGPCSSTAWNFNVQCPTALNQIISTSPQSTSSAACTAELNSSIHHVPVAGTAQNLIQVNDYIFVDHDGATPATAGWYGSPFGYTYEVGPKGVVINKQTSCNHITVQDCTNQNLYTFNDRFGTNSVGEVIQYRRINQTTFQIEAQVYCGTITNMGSGTYTNAVQEGFIDYDCTDTVHCP